MEVNGQLCVITFQPFQIQTVRVYYVFPVRRGGVSYLCDVSNVVGCVLIAAASVAGPTPTYGADKGDSGPQLPLAMDQLLGEWTTGSCIRLYRFDALPCNCCSSAGQ